MYNSAASSAEKDSPGLAAIYVLLSIVSGSGLLGKTQLLRQVLHLPAIAISILVPMALCAPLFWRFALRYQSIVAILFVAGLLTSSLVVYPKVVALHSIGRGSDQADCLIVGAKKITSLQWPYDSSFIWSKNPMSCGPGWIMLQSFFIRVAGYGATLLIFWGICFHVIARAIGRNKAISLAALLALSPGIWLSAVDGSDFVTFGIALTALTVVTLKTKRYKIAFIVIASLIFNFRTPMSIMPGFWKKNVGFTAALATGLVAIVTQMAFFIWDPAHYIQSGPLHLLHKAFGVPMMAERPTILVFYVTVSLIIGLYCALWIGQRVKTALSSLCFLIVLMGIPGLLDLVSKVRAMGAILPALGKWEGGVWLTAGVSLAALLVVEREIPRISAVNSIEIL